jgi:uncharacterized protein
MYGFRCGPQVRPMSKFSIKIKDIPPEGRVLDLPFDRPWSEEALAGVEASLREGGAKVRVERMGEDVLVQGTLRGTVLVPCGRCLAPATIDLGAEVRMIYTPEEEADDKADVEGEDVDYATYAGNEIDLGAFFREQILLAIPMTPRCKEDCRGLCPQCGVDLNQESCSCARPTDPRWESLKGLKM